MEHIIKEIENVPAFGRADAERLADEITKVMIATLQRDSNRSFFDWWLVLASARQQIADHIHHRIHGNISRDEAIYASRETEPS
jgi:hypothetical protein